MRKKIRIINLYVQRDITIKITVSIDLLLFQFPSVKREKIVY